MMPFRKSVSFEEMLNYQNLILKMLLNSASGIFFVFIGMENIVLVRLAFRCRSSPKLFDSLPQAVCWIATNNYGVKISYTYWMTS